MSTFNEDAWVRPEDERWGDAVRWRLAVTHSAATLELIEEVLTEAQQACAESGLPAKELFGEAEKFADQVADERISDEARAAVDMDGIAPSEQLHGAALAVGFIGVAMSVLLLVAVRAWVVEVSAWQLVVLAGGNVACAAAVGAVMARRAGQIRRSWTLVALTVAALGLGAGIAIPLEGNRPIGELPTFVPLVVYLTIFIVAWNIPRATPRLADQQDSPADQWFTQLDGLLRGRYYLTGGEASRYVAEARAMWQESATEHPQDEFSSPQVYALRVLDGSQQPHRAQRRFLAWAATVIAAVWIGLTVVYLLTGAEPGELLWRVIPIIVFVIGAVIAWRRHLRDRKRRSTWTP